MAWIGLISYISDNFPWSAYPVGHCIPITGHLHHPSIHCNCDSTNNSLCRANNLLGSRSSHNRRCHDCRHLAYYNHCPLCQCYNDRRHCNYYDRFYCLHLPSSWHLYHWCNNYNCTRDNSLCLSNIDLLLPRHLHTPRADYHNHQDFGYLRLPLFYFISFVSAGNGDNNHVNCFFDLYEFNFDFSIHNIHLQFSEFDVHNLSVYLFRIKKLVFTQAILHACDIQKD